MKLFFLLLLLLPGLFLGINNENILDQHSSNLILPSNMKQTTNNYLALGDSYTIGESVKESERYPNQLAAILNKSGFNMNNPVIIAKTGWTTDELMAGIKLAKIEHEKFDLVTLLIGVNNQYRGRDTSNYKLEFIALLEKAIFFTDGDASKVVVISIPDWGITPFAKNRDREKIAKEIDAFNGIKERITKEKQAHYVNITDISREAKTNKDLLAEDGLHPSGLMYKNWVTRIIPIVSEILKKELKSPNK